MGVVIKEIRVSFTQFFSWRYPIKSLVRVLGIITSTFTRLLLGRSLKYSYAFTGEDRIIEGILKPLITKKGSYVEVGCNHPKFLSNSYGLYRKGWRGICIDANESLIKKYAFYRPKDIAVHALVSDTSNERTFYISENDVLSTTETSNLEDIKLQGLRYESHQIQSRTLTSILDEYSFTSTFDLLSIDAEEHDYEVLTSLDFEKYCPSLIIIEDETFDLAHQDNCEIHQFLIGKGFKLEGFVLKNLYYVKG